MCITIYKTLRRREILAHLQCTLKRAQAQCISILSNLDLHFFLCSNSNAFNSFDLPSWKKVCRSSFLPVTLSQNQGRFKYAVTEISAVFRYPCGKTEAIAGITKRFPSGLPVETRASDGKTHTKLAFFLSRCAGKSDDNILWHLQVDSCSTSQSKCDSFLTVYKEYRSIRLQAHGQLNPLVSGEGVSPGEAKAAPSFCLVFHSQGVIEGGGDDLEDR